MKSILTFAVVSMFATGLAFAAAAAGKAGKCCATAAKDGKACAHKCCVEAAKSGKYCEKCGGSGELPKSQKK
jgi:adenine/guanine phosphoribosyltransferase-like PRPP-binding protein